MMLPTHILLGLSLLTPIVYLLPPKFILPLSFGVIIGSIIPDFDLLFGTHRKTLHSPIISWGFVGISALVFITNPSLISTSVFALTLGFSQHSITDILGSGLEHKPWKKTSSKAVYSHYHDAWFNPKHYASYDGSPQDLTLTVLLAIFSYSFYNPLDYYSLFLISIISIASIYTISRKKLPMIENHLYQNFPILQPLLKTFFDKNRGRVR